jgi:hypothetical protein
MRFISPRFMLIFRMLNTYPDLLTERESEVILSIFAWSMVQGVESGKSGKWKLIA